MPNKSLTNSIVLLVLAVAATGCETERPAPYLLTAPTPIGVEISGASAWDSAEDFKAWVQNPLTEGSFSIAQDAAVAFVHVELKPATAFRLWSPNFVPPFTNLRAVRVRYRHSPAPGDPTAALLNISAFVKPTLEADPANPLLPMYFGQAGAASSTWRTVDLLADRDRGFPATVDGLWVYLTFGRSGRVSVDIDRVELLR